jgi:sulfopyruvate decarboxylase subunit alpha
LEGTAVIAELADDFVHGFKAADIGLVCGLPDSWLKDVHVAAAEEPAIRYVAVCNEGVGFSVCAGAWLGGTRSALVMEVSGLRVAAEYLARLGLGIGVPVVLVMSYRGDFGETQHWGMPHGIVAEPLLKALRIPYAVVQDAAGVRQALVRARRMADARLGPTAVLIGRRCIAKSEEL